MKKAIIMMTMLALAALLGFLGGRQATSVDGTASGSAGSAEREVLYWVAPMDANFRRDEPGLSPMGMELAPVYADTVDGESGTVKINPTVANNLGLRTAVAERSPLSRRIETVGYVGYDEDTLIHVHTRVEGWIENLVTKASGERVQKGQLLFELYSPTLVNAQEEYLAALRSGNAALKRASRNRLAALGISASEITRLDNERKVSQRIRFYAKADGVIATLGVREGYFVTPSTKIMSVAQLDRVWVIAEVFERQTAWVEAGQDAVVTLDYLPGVVLEATVDYVYPELDPDTRTLKVRLRLENAAERLRPNMFAKVLIYGKSTGDIVHVPREAVIRGSSTNRVVVALGDGRYRSRRVVVGVESGDRVAIRSGLAAGERIVTSAQFLIDSESNIDSALRRMDQGEMESLQ